MARGSFVRPDLRRFPQFLCGPSPSLSLPRTTFAVLGRVTLPPFLDPPPPYHGQVLEAWDPPPVTTDGCWDVCESKRVDSSPPPPNIPQLMKGLVNGGARAGRGDTTHTPEYETVGGENKTIASHQV